MQKSRTSGPTLAHERTPHPTPRCPLCLRRTPAKLRPQGEWIDGQGYITYHAECLRIVQNLRRQYRLAEVFVA